MIKIVKRGDYQLVEMKNSTKIFVLDSTKALLWNTDTVSLLDVFLPLQSQLALLARGKYMLYDVKNEEQYTQTLHWELSLGKRTWQGYLLTNGLPTKKEPSKPITPTTEILTKTV